MFGVVHLEIHRFYLDGWIIIHKRRINVKNPRYLDKKDLLITLGIVVWIVVFL